MNSSQRDVILNPVQSSKPEKEQPSSLEPDDLEAQAFNDYEEALTRSIQEKVRDKE